MKNTGESYENFVKSLHEALLHLETLGIQKNIKIEMRKKITDNCGIDREFDLYWEYELGGITYKTVIECKDYNSAVSVEKIDALIGKIKDLPDLKPVFATKIGYQSGAQKKAEQNKIDLLIVRKPLDSDWVDEQGNPLINKVAFTLSMGYPARITGFYPKVSESVLKEMKGNTSFAIAGNNNEIFINDGEKTVTWLDLENKLPLLHKDEFGQFEETKIFSKEGEIKTPSSSLKIIGYTVKYEVKKPDEETMLIDASDAMYGVIEYLGKDKKTLFWKNGKIEKRKMMRE
ncbi:restriction endonuclease [Fibrobacter sp. UWB11]|uniref:restriction endonuclease n=1 Tax=Fibrobacter sp. UWB11 TaxID=1896202 RepID=UPI000926975C|nr:restriction endonuclease [Fibrobacter sp. UWB11]SIO32296.1 Restriction endonuclease [Fibrobacter sp. UWB11]